MSSALTDQLTAANPPHTHRLIQNIQSTIKKEYKEANAVASLPDGLPKPGFQGFEPPTGHLLGSLGIRVN